MPNVHQVHGSSAHSADRAQGAVFASLRKDGFAALEGRKATTPPAAVQKAIEKTVDTWGGEGLGSVEEKSFFGHKVYVATSNNYDKDTVESFGFFDDKGALLARAYATMSNDTSALTLQLDRGGKPGQIIAEASKPSALVKEAWVKKAEKAIEKKYGDDSDIGKDMEIKDAPKALQPALSFIERNTADGTGLQKVAFEGRTLYAMHKYECVSSVILFAESGEQLFQLTGG